jgi:N-acetylneuraminate synthase
MVKMVAEIGINHNGSVDLARRMMGEAAAAGWGYAKFQKRNPDKCVPESQKGKIRDTPWGRMTYLDYKKRIELSEGEYDSLLDSASEMGIVVFASVFDMDSLEFMEGRSDIVKIGSANIGDLELCKRARKKFGTLIVSTGMSSEREVDECVRGCEPDVVMHTVSSYPCAPERLWLNRIGWMRNKYPGVSIGYSGHEKGVGATIGAVALGAEWIERHITLDKRMWGTDQGASIDPSEMAVLNSAIGELEAGMSMPSGARTLLDCEIQKREATRA